MTTGTVEFHRVLKSTPERIYRAFVTPEAFAKWLPPFGFCATVHAMEPKVGGSYRMSFTNHTTGAAEFFGGDYLELEPNARVRYSARFDDPNMPGEMQTTVTLREVLCGVEVRIVQSGIPEMIPTEMCYLGWQESLVQLAQLVEPEIRQ